MEALGLDDDDDTEGAAQENEAGVHAPATASNPTSHTSAGIGFGSERAGVNGDRRGEREIGVNGDLSPEIRDKERALDAADEATRTAERAASTGELPGFLRQGEMERAYEIFCGDDGLDFQAFLTGLGVLRWARGRVGCSRRTLVLCRSCVDREAGVMLCVGDVRWMPLHSVRDRTRGHPHRHQMGHLE